jgi:hypothetical protein
MIGSKTPQHLADRTILDRLAFNSGLADETQ